jgi:hypothetical protein
MFKMDENSKREAEELEVARTKHEKSLLVCFCSPPHALHYIALHCIVLRLCGPAGIASQFRLMQQIMAHVLSLSMSYLLVKAPHATAFL